MVAIITMTGKKRINTQIVGIDTNPANKIKGIPIMMAKTVNILSINSFIH